MQFSWKKDQFDTLILGMNTAKITSISTIAAIPNLIDDLKKANIEYALYRFGSTEISLAQALEMNGFILVDGAIAFKNSSLETLKSTNIRIVTETDVERLKQISGESFDLTRFFSDPIIDKEKARTIYRTWIENSVLGDAADAVLVYDAGEIAGYATIKGEHIPLVAVEKKYQGQGIGKLLVKAALSHIKSSGGTDAYIETQIQNISAIRAYTACGFKAIETFFTYRIHLKP